MGHTTGRAYNHSLSVEDLKGSLEFTVVNVTILADARYTGRDQEAIRKQLAEWA